MQIDRPVGLDQPWTRTVPARAIRELLVCGVFANVIDLYARRETVGRERIAALGGPAIFVANHCSHMDTPLLLRSLPGRRRRRTLVVAAADYFYTRRLLARSVSLAFGTVPLERQGRGAVSEATAHLERLVEDGWSLIMFPEGTRSRDGRVGRLLPGAAVLAAERGLPIVPVHVHGTHAAMPVGRRWLVRPHVRAGWARHRIRVSFGAPIRVGPGEDRFEVMELVRRFMQECGAHTTPDPKLEARRTAATTRGATGSPPVSAGGRS